MAETHAQGGGQALGGENPLGGGQALGGGQVLGGGEIPVGGPQQMALMFEMIKGMQQNQVELAESLRQLREANGNKEDHQNKNDNHNHEERESHNKNDTPFVTMSDVADLLKQERERPLKEPRHFVRRPSYPIGLLKEPYPEKYDTPVFALFDGKKRKRHGTYQQVPGFHGTLCCTCKYFHVEEKINLVNLHSTKQQTGEDLVKYIHRFRDVSLDCHVKYQEGELVEVCIDNMLPEFCADLENLDISRFAPLLQKARKTALYVKPQVERNRDKKSLPQTLTVSTTTAPSGTKRKNPTEKVYEEPPPLPFTVKEMMAIFDKWVQDQVIKLPKISKQPTAKEQKDPKYCRYHRYVNHPTVDCRTLRWEVNRKIQNGTLQLSEEQQKVHQTPFPNYNKGKGKAVVSVVIHGNVSDMEAEESTAAKAHASRAFLETTNAITFTDEDMEVQYPDHRCPLYLSAVVKDVQVRRALVDTGSCLNLIPLSTLQAVNVPQQKIQGSPMEVTEFRGVTEYTMAACTTCIESRADCGTHTIPCSECRSSLPRAPRCVGPDCPQQEGPTPEEGGLQPSCHLIQQTENSGKVVVDQLQSTAMSSEEVTVDHAQPMVMNPQEVAVDQTESIATNTKKVAEDRTESTAMSPGVFTVDHSQSTVMNSEEEDTVDQTKPTTMRREESTTAEPNLTSKEELEVINLSNDPNVSKPISISKSLSAKERKCLIDLLHEYKDVFAWDYDEMPGIDPGLVAHSLNVEPGTRPVVQPIKTFHTEVEAQITQEVKNLLAASFIKPIQHPRWLSNIVPVKKKNGQIRCCVDLRNLNKACPKDEFPLPNMDLLIDSAAGHAMFSFMDGFSGYNQIRMSTKDAEETAFRTPIGNFYYTIMPFGLKNAGATYQRTMTAMFHDMMHKEIENYVDDIVVKFKKREDHLGILRKVFDRCRLYKLKMNPLKCAFGVSAGKFLGFLVHNRGIDVDPAKASAIATMKAPTSHKELKSFLGRLSYIRRFIPGLAAVTAVFTPLMKKGVPFVWSTACQQAFEKIQVIMTKLPIVCAPVPGRPLRLYLASNSKAIGGLVAQEDEDETERPIYYVSRALRDAETRYSGAERACLALIYASQPIKSQAIADLLAQFPGEDSSSISHEVPGGMGEALLADLEKIGETIAKSFKLDFSCSNNASEYEAYITGLAIAHEMGVKHLRVIGDSNLIICQTKGEFSLKEPSLALYRALAQKLEEKFDSFEISHAMRCENRYADALATLGSQVSFEESKVDVTIDKRSMSITDLLREKFKVQNLDAEDWRTPIKTKLMSPEGVADLKVLKDYVLIAGDLYRRLPRGVLARCVNLQEAAKKLIEIHEKCCEFRVGVSLYRRLQHLGYFWPSMSKEAASLQEQCSFCQHQHESDQIYATFISSDWRTPFLEYLIENILPQTSQAATRLKKLATRYFVGGGILFQKGFHGDPLRCLSLAESQTVMKEAPFWRMWRTSRQEKIIPAAIDSWLLLANHEERYGRLHLIGPINPSSGGYIWILVATEYFSKWVEAIPLRKATGAAVANFIREHIITRFGIPHKIISDNGTPFVNKNVREVLEHYQIKHRRSTPYYPQGNGQAEATDRMLLRILCKMVFDYRKGWSSHLANTLWAYRGSTKTATGFTPFFLVYSTDAISPTELLVPSPRILHGMDLEADADICAETRVADLESLKEGQMVLRTVDHVRRGLPSPSKFAPNWEGPYLIREAYDSGYYKLSIADGTTLVDPINGKWLKHYYS
uniref:Integrase catalytic domain-containing protein n=1 Tax=Fagus sylvatica TaxID=28930 RepID=A0A2N9H3G7_FAGSY